MSTQSIAFTIDNQSPFTLQLYGTYQHGAMWTGGTEQAGWVSNDPPHDRMAGTIGVVVHSEEYQLYLWIGLNADLASANQTAASISDSNTEVGQEWHQMLSEHGQKDVVYQTQTGSHFQVNSYMQPGPNAEAVFSFYLH